MNFKSRTIGIGMLMFVLVLIVLMVLNGYIQNRILFNAIENNDNISAKKAVERGAWVNFRKYFDIGPVVELVGNNPTPLNLACRIGNQEIVEYLVYHGANVNSKSRFTKDTPLFHALHGTKNNRYSLAMFLINNGADVYDEDLLDMLGRKVLYISSVDNTETINEGYQLFKFLLDKDVPLYISGNQENLLTFAAKYSTPKHLNLLLEFGYYNVDDFDHSQETALIAAVKKDKTEVVSLLLELGADTTLVDAKGKTALDWANETNNVAIIGLLEKNKSSYEKHMWMKEPFCVKPKEK